MQKSFKIDEAEYKRACKYGADSLINKNMRPYASNAEVAEVNGEYWLSYQFDGLRYRADQTQQEADYLNGFSHTIV